MAKIKAIDQQYTMPEITAIVDELYPFGEYKIIDVGKPEKVSLRYDKIVEEGVVNKAFVESRNFEFDHKKKALMELFFTLNKCNRIMAGQYTTPLTPEECEMVVSDREKAFNHLQAIVNPVKPQLPTINNTEKEQRAFERAVEAGYMERTNTGYKWNGKKVQLAVFANFLYEKAIPFKAIERLFGVSRIDSALNGWRMAAKTPKWQKEIEDLTREA